MPTQTRYFSATTLEDLSRSPLHRYPGIRDGDVPDWVHVKVCGKEETKRLIAESDWETGADPRVYRSKGIRAVSVVAQTLGSQTSAIEWEIEPETYLKLQQQTTDEAESTVRFGICLGDSNEKPPLASTQTQAPEHIQCRLNDAQSTDTWQEKSRVGDFKQWWLSYSLDRSGDVTNACIEAEFRR